MLGFSMTPACFIAARRSLDLANLRAVSRRFHSSNRLTEEQTAALGISSFPSASSWLTCDYSRCPSQVPPFASLFVVSGQMVLDQITPRTSAPASAAPLRLARVRLARLKFAPVRLRSFR
jgi:hypothetical protein